MSTNAEQNSRLERLTRMLLDMSSDTDPVSSLNRYSACMRALYGNQGLMSLSLRDIPSGCYRVMRFLHQEGVALEGFRDTMFAGPSAVICEGGLLGDIICGDGPAILRDLHCDDDPILGNQLSPYRMLAAFPVFDAGRTTNWVVFLSTDSECFSSMEIESRYLQANLVGSLTNNKRLAKELREALAWIEREVDEIAHIQRSMLPSKLPAVPGIEFSAYYATFDRAGGDFYDAFRARSGGERWGVFIGDASGHGPSAAVVVAVLSTLLHSHSGALHSPGEILAYLNRHFVERSTRGSFVTAFFGFLDPVARRLTYACAGHNAPLLRDADGSTRTLAPRSGLPLGISPLAEYEDTEDDLAAGQTLLLYTDGITEARNPEGVLLGEDALQRLLRESRDTPDDLVHAIIEALRVHERGRRPQDDRTLLVLKLT